MGEPARPVPLPDFRHAPNQAGRPDLYELENLASDPEGCLLAAMRASAPWRGRTLVDLGCGSGFWLPGYAGEAAEVIGVEPDPGLLRLAAARDPRVRVLRGSAEHTTTTGAASSPACCGPPGTARRASPMPPTPGGRRGGRSGPRC